jgi:Ca-activated chloride channel homolog
VRPIARLRAPRLLASAAAAALLLALASQASAQVHVALVLDASGSMYNRLADGRYRIDAAKAVLQGIVAGLPDDDRLSVGLRVYGARLFAADDLACNDSHLEVPIDGVDRAALTGAVAATVARGATPIVHSLELTLDDLPATGDRRVVLVTDGLESCGGNLAAIAERYAGLGIDLRIVGIDLEAAAAERFGAVAAFVNAATAIDLDTAIQDALGTEAASERSPVPVSVRVTRDGAPATAGVTVALVDPVTGARTRLEPDEEGAFVGYLPPDTYAVELVDAFADDRTSVFGDLTVSDDGASFAFELAPTATVRLAVEPAQPTAGTAIRVTFEGGPDGAIGAVVLAPVDAPDTVRLYQAFVSDGRGAVDLLTPDAPGTFEARFLLALPEGGRRVVGRSEPFATTAATAALAVPAEVAAGTNFEVVWDGPAGPGDRLELRVVGPADGPVATVRTFSRPATLAAPVGPGTYELRYVTGGSGNVLATARVTVVEALVEVTVPAVVGPDTLFDVTVSGAIGPRDTLVLVQAGAPDEGADTIGPAKRLYTTTVTFRAPRGPGELEVRYLTGDGRVVQRFRVTVR